MFLRNKLCEIRFANSELIEQKYVPSEQTLSVGKELYSL